MRPCGEVMNTRTPFLPRIAYSAALPVSPRGRAQDVELLAAARQFVLEQVAQQLHRHVLEGQRRAVGQGFQEEAVLQLLQRHDLAAAENFLRCRSCGTARAGRPPECRRCRATGSRTPGPRKAGRAIAPAWPRRPADSARAGTGRHRAPGLPAGFRRNACGRHDRGSRDSASGQLFLADARDGRQHRGQAPASAPARRSWCLRARCGSG